jgi:hypothetical protein
LFSIVILTQPSTAILSNPSVIYISVSKDNSRHQCIFPSFLTSRHHDWRSIDDLSSLHLNKRGHSFKLRNLTDTGKVVEKHATCHRVEDLEIVGRKGEEEKEVVAARVVAYVKSGW